MLPWSITHDTRRASWPHHTSQMKSGRDEKRVLAGACCHVPRQEAVPGPGQLLQQQSLWKAWGNRTRQTGPAGPSPRLFFFFNHLGPHKLQRALAPNQPPPPRLTQEMEPELETQASPEDLDSPSQTASPTALAGWRNVTSSQPRSWRSQCHPQLHTMTHGKWVEFVPKLSLRPQLSSQEGLRGFCLHTYTPTWAQRL